MVEIIKRESIYLWYYFTVQLQQLAKYWIYGIIIGSVISVFFKDKINKLFGLMQNKKLGILGVIPASALGIASPLCMYGTIPIAATFSANGMADYLLASFMMSSILLNPQLIMYSGALGKTALIIRIGSCFICGIVAGVCVRFFFKEKKFFDFEKMNGPENHDTDPNILIRLLKNIGRNIKATGPYFLIGLLLSACMQRYLPNEFITQYFGKHSRFGIILAATIGVPLYACGGGTIPLLQDWLYRGMSMGSVAAFMLTGPATKITNLGALKIVLKGKHFWYYIIFVIAFAMITGLVLNIFI